MDDWQCHDKSVRFLWRVLCERINLACVLRFQDKWTTEAPALTFTTRGIHVCNCLCPAEDRQGKTQPLRHHFPKLSPSLPPCVLPQTPCASLSFFPRPFPHCTACSLAVLPESWGFMTSGSSGGVEKGSILSCSNESSGRRTETGSDDSETRKGRRNMRHEVLIKLWRAVKRELLL